MMNRRHRFGDRRRRTLDPALVGDEGIALQIQFLDAELAQGHSLRAALGSLLDEPLLDRRVSALGVHEAAAATFRDGFVLGYVYARRRVPSGT